RRRKIHFISGVAVRSILAEDFVYSHCCFACRKGMPLLDNVIMNDLGTSADLIGTGFFIHLAFDITRIENAVGIDIQINDDGGSLWLIGISNTIFIGINP